MKKYLYAIRDIKANNYSEFQWQDVNDECAIRTIGQMVNDLRPNKLNSEPASYELYKLGEINLETGEITPGKEFLKTLSELKKPEDKTKTEILNKLAELYNAIRGDEKYEV